LGYVEGKKKIHSLKLVVSIVFDLQNEFHDNRTRFEGFVKKNLRGLFWQFLGSSTFGPQNFCQELSDWSGNLPILFLHEESEKNGPGRFVDPPQIPT
jgi:hypothetical protein